MKDTFRIDEETGSVKVAGDTQFYLYNHSKESDTKQNSLSRMGIWMDHDFSWLHDKEWQRETYSKSESGIRLSTSYQHTFQSLSIGMEEVIHPSHTFYLRKIELKNHFNIRRNVRLFFYQNISPTHHIGGDTAFFAPREKVFYHYRKNSCWLFNGVLETNGIKQYTAFSQMSSKPLDRHCFNKEEGILFFNPIAKGYVTSVFSLEAELPALDKLTGYYWIAADDNKQQVHDINQRVMKNGPKEVFDQLSSLDKKSNQVQEGIYLPI